MKRSPNRLLLLAGASSLLVALPALSQQTPESILPPGFEAPKAPPPAPPQESPPADPAAPAPEVPAPVPDTPRDRGGVPAETVVEDSAAADLQQLPPAPPPYTVDVPAGLRRSLEVVGLLEPGNWGLGIDAFGRANGAYLSGLMRRVDGPLPSRWASILLRRALLSRVAAPRAAHPVDWVAERAALLLRMGEADAGRALVQSVDVSDYTPRMVAAGLDAALATSDPAGLCPLIRPGRSFSSAPVWGMSEAICAALTGEAARAGQLVDQARGRGRVRGIDLLLAEKVIGAGTDSRRAVTIQWEEVDRLTPWRFGLATATGMEIPDRLVGGAGPAFQAWLARAPMVPVEQRLSAAASAAALGVLSNSALVEMHSLALEAADPEDADESPSGRLRTAYSGPLGGRIDALEALWGDDTNPVQRYARRVLTAGAAARIPPDERFRGQTADLIEAMLSAGMDRQAARWAPLVGAGEGGERAWALLAVGAPRPVVDSSAGRIETFRDADDSRDKLRSKMLLAGLAGLGRIDGAAAAALAGDFAVDFGRRGSWSRAIQDAAAAGQPGTVALLAAVGMQTGSWGGVPPAHLYQIVSALRRVGLEFEARMIAAEAMTRL